MSGFIEGKNRMPITSTKQEYILKTLSKFHNKEIPIIMEGLFSPKDLSSILKEKDLIMKHYKNA